MCVCVCLSANCPPPPLSLPPPLLSLSLSLILAFSHSCCCLGVSPLWAQLPLHTDRQVVDLFITSLHLRQAERGSVLYRLAVHHSAGFLFQDFGHYTEQALKVLKVCFVKGWREVERPGEPVALVFRWKQRGTHGQKKGKNEGGMECGGHACSHRQAGTQADRHTDRAVQEFTASCVDSCCAA